MKKISYFSRLFIFFIILCVFSVGCISKKKLNSIENLVTLNEASILYLEEYCNEIPPEVLEQLKKDLEKEKEMLLNNKKD